MKFLSLTEAWITNKKDHSVLHFSEFDDQKKWKSSVRLASGFMIWEWHKTRKSAREWINKFRS